MTPANLIRSLLRSSCAYLAILSAWPCAGDVPQSILDTLKNLEVKAVPKGTLHSYKCAEDVYLTNACIEIVADATEKRFAGLWTGRVNGIRYTCNLKIREEILALDEATGEVASQLEVVQCIGALEGSGVGFSFAGLRSEQLITWYMSLGAPQLRKAIRAGGRGLAEMLVSYVSPFGEKFGGNLGDAAAEWLWTRTGSWLRSKGLAPNPDGTLPVDRTTLAKLLNGSVTGDKNHLGAVLEVRNVEGSVWEVPWTLGGGYGELKCSNRADVLKNAANPRTVNEDLDALAGAIRASSMVSTGLIFPPSSEGAQDGVPWEVDARAFALMLLQSVKFDWLEGSVWLSKAGTDYATGWKDEQDNTGKKQFQERYLAVDAAKESCITGVMEDQGGTITTFAFIPGGQLSIVDDPDIPSKYVRNALLTGALVTIDEEHAGSLLSGVQVTGTVKMKASFSQIRIAPHDK